MNILHSLTLLPHLFFFPNRAPDGPYGYSPTCGWINILYERKLCLSDRMAEFGLFTCDSTCQWGCVSLVGFAACRRDCVRVRCDRGVQERPCEGAVWPRQPCGSVPPSHFENFRQAWQKCVAKFGNARPRPKQDKYVRTRSTSVKKERRGFPSRDLIDTNPRFTCQLMHIFFSKDQRANHLTPHRLINAAPCKPTFSLPHACRGY